MSLRYLLGYSYYPYEFDVKDIAEAWLSRLRLAGINVHGTCLAVDPPSQCLLFDEIDRRWRSKEPKLMRLYDDLAEQLEDYDVFINWNGINLHPEFVSSLSTFNVYGCYDDPESSEVLSKPVANSYDLCMVGNIAELDTYRSWGVKNVEFWPIGFKTNDYDPSLTVEKILTGEREITVSLTCERVSPFRRERLDKLALAHPHGAYFGKGWPNGFLPESDRVPLLQKTKIGINIHNSTGPVNYRTFWLPANGVLQLCDNTKHLGKIFEVGKEVLGYESIEEAIDQVQYYLERDSERREIAAAGFKRSLKDYNEVEVFRILERAVEPLYASEKQTKPNNVTVTSGSENQMKQYKELDWTDNLVKRFWDYESQFIDNYFTYQVGQSVVEELAEYYPDAQTALDYGCGLGFLMHYLLRRGLEVTGLDFSDASLEQVRKLYNGVPNFAGAYGLELLAKKIKYDLIYVVEVIEHLTDEYLDLTMKNTAQLLQPGGRAIFTTPHAEDRSRSTVYCPNCDHTFHRWQHVRSWTVNSLQAYLEANNFIVLDIFATNFSHRPLTKIRAYDLARRPYRFEEAPHLTAITTIR